MGQIQLDKKGKRADMVNTDVHGHIEPKSTYMRRCLFIAFILLGLTTLMLTIMIISLFYILKTINQIHSKYRISPRVAMQNGLMMRLMNKFPYSKFML